MLKHAKLSGEILLNLVNNVLDAAKLKSEKMEVSYTETNVGSIIEKVFLINSERIQKLKLTAEVYISDSIPSTLWIDPSRLLQIMMNLTSNALKFTEKRGNIKMYIDWCPIDETYEKLEQPVQKMDHQVLKK